MRNFKTVVLPVAAAVCFVLPSFSALAQGAPAASSQTQTSNKKAKTVKFTIKNKSEATMNLQSGDEQISLAAGESRAMKAPAGTKIVNNTASTNGAVVAEVTDEMGGATINLR